MALGTILILPLGYWLYYDGMGIGVIYHELIRIPEWKMLTFLALVSACWLAFTCSQIAIAERHPGRTPTVIAGLFYFIVIGLIAAGIGGFVVMMLRALDAV